MRRRPPETLPLPSLPVAASYSRNGRTVKESPAFAPRRGVAGDDFLSRRAASRNTLRAAQSGRKGRGRRSPVTNDRTGPVLARMRGFVGRLEMYAGRVRLVRDGMGGGGGRVPGE